jgi:hypothetical protein
MEFQSFRECGYSVMERATLIYVPNTQGYNWATLFRGGGYRNLALRVGGISKIETIKYAHESRGTRI